MLLVLTYWSVAFLVSLLIWSFKLGRLGTKDVLYFWLVFSLVVVLGLVMDIILMGNKVWYILCNWLYVLDTPIVFEYNMLSTSMVLLIEVVSSLVLWYVSGYSYGDLSYIRLLLLIILFKLSMLMLVMGENLLSVFIGWELVGIVSFGLIIYWFTGMHNVKSAIQAMLMNKVGDIGILLALIILYVNMGGVDTVLIHYYFNENWFFICYFPLLVGAFAKSGQIGLHFWLPNAMAAPTPVSALLHSATMVTAGVYIGIIFGLSSKCLVLLASYSLLVLGSFGLIEYDYKRTIAYSTGSQLGYMFVGVGLGLYTLSFFHLLVHAIFKSTLFLSSGLVLYVCSDEQDIRRLGGLKVVIPLGYMSTMIGTLSILGFPYLGAYYSKELLILGAWLLDYDGWFLLVFGILFTSYYSYRVFDKVYNGVTKANKSIFNVFDNSSISMYVVLFTMCILVIYWGYIISDLFNGILSGKDSYFDTEFVIWVNDIILIWMLLGLCLTRFVHDSLMYFLDKYCYSWGFEGIYKSCLMYIYSFSDKVIWRLSDKGVNEGLLVLGWYRFKRYKWYSVGLIYDYMLVIVLYLGLFLVLGL